jgi:hypothetical protein
MNVPSHESSAVRASPVELPYDSGGSSRELVPSVSGGPTSLRSDGENLGSLHANHRLRMHRRRFRHTLGLHLPVRPTLTFVQPMSR